MSDIGKEMNPDFSPEAGRVSEPRDALSEVLASEAPRTIDVTDAVQVKIQQDAEVAQLQARIAELERQLKPSNVDPSTLQILPFSNVGRTLSRPGRTIKMFKPGCNAEHMGLEGVNCQNKGGQWWVGCEHDPYFNVYDKTVREPVIEENEQGELEIVRYVEKIIRIKTPRTAQVHLTIRSNSGLGVEKKRVRGYKFLEEKGYHPVCQFLNCWDPNVRFRTEYGDYCSRDEAAINYLVEEGIAYEVYSPKVARAQLAGVPV